MQQFGNNVIVIIPVEIPIVLWTDLRPAAFLKIMHYHRLVNIRAKCNLRSIHSDQRYSIDTFEFAYRCASRQMSALRYSKHPEDYRFKLCKSKQMPMIK